MGKRCICLQKTEGQEEQWITEVMRGSSEPFSLTPSYCCSAAGEIKEISTFKGTKYSSLSWCFDHFSLHWNHAGKSDLSICCTLRISVIRQILGIQKYSFWKGKEKTTQVYCGLCNTVLEWIILKFTTIYCMFRKVYNVVNLADCFPAKKTSRNRIWNSCQTRCIFSLSLSLSPLYTHILKFKTDLNFKRMLKPNPYLKFRGLLWNQQEFKVIFRAPELCPDP